MDAEEHELMTTTEVAKYFRVDPKTVTRWAKDGLIKTVWTLGGHRRYRKVDVEPLVEARYECSTEPIPGQTEIGIEDET